MHYDYVTRYRSQSAFGYHQILRHGIAVAEAGSTLGSHFGYVSDIL